MKLPAAIEKQFAKLDALSVRERVLVVGAVAVGIVMIFTIAILDPITAKHRSLTSEIDSIQSMLNATSETLEAAAANDPVTLALTRERELKERLEGINAELNSQSAGLIPPERMVEVIHDVLSRQRGVKLISLHNKPVTGLADSTKAPSADGTTTAASLGSGPYMHPIELVIEGRYLDVMNYLRELETLPWHFYWKRLELNSTDYPLNRVRIELGTLSMEKDWIGV